MTTTKLTTVCAGETFAEKRARQLVICVQMMGRQSCRTGDCAFLGPFQTEEERRLAMQRADTLPAPASEAA